MPMYEEQFTAPGTWTKPATVAQVEIIAIGGGGGGAGPNTGGGGGIVRKVIPVTSPVPVTVGAGGTAVSPPAPPTSAGTVGGTSGFGPLGPGPVPAIPPTTVAAGGGGAGVFPGAPAPVQPRKDAPPIGGGGGGTNPVGLGGLGYPSSGNGPGAMGSSSYLVAYSPQTGPNIQYGARGLYGYGGGGVNPSTAISSDGGGNWTNAAVANMGGGSNGPTPGGSGLVIVRYWQ